MNGLAEGNRRALVTGASSGIGAAFCRGLRARGERLILVARRMDRLERLVGELGGPDMATAVPLDLTDPSAPGRLQAEVDRRGLVVDLLVNNAGLGDNGRFHELPLERSLAILDLNARALVELTRRFLPGMVERRRGRIVNVVSMSAFQPVPFLAVYAASKAFVLSFTEAIATELEGTGVTIQALCPGNVPTEFQRVAGTSGTLYDKTPSVSPDDVAAASLSALEAGRLTVIPRLQDRLTVAAQGFLPRSLVRGVAARLFRPR